MTRPSDWSPSPEDKQRLLGFEGYGPDAPEIIFVGIEEYTHPDLERQRDAIFIRCTDPAFAGKRVDKNAATRALTGGSAMDDVRVWRVASAIVCGLTGRREAEEYEALGSRPVLTHPSSWMTELFPLPRHPKKKNLRGTYIEGWFDFRGRTDYERRAAAGFGPRFLPALRVSPPPRFAFFYGKASCDWARDHLADQLKAPLQQLENGVEIGETKGGTRIVLTGFYEGQHGASAFRVKHIPALIARLR
jgi:hypothetical protein